MRTLCLLRHAKSSWGDSSLRDHDRPLSPRGRRAAPEMARFMADEGLVPELVLCSTAVRTRETWSLMEPVLGDGIAVSYDENLYGASAGTLLRAVQAVPDDTRRVLLIGHNPGIEVLAGGLVGSGSEKAARKLTLKYPTAALAQLSCEADHWADITAGGFRLDRFVRPKDLPGADAWNL